ncbi:MAG: TldD/PmbA family protein [Desulfurococcales archaeon]|nr:TldD/PmbA family protein [Desulfurococcales archaeon]
MPGALDPASAADLFLEEAGRLGVEYADARVEVYRYRLVVVENGVVKESSYTTTTGIGVRVVEAGYQGYASTTSLEREAIRAAIEEARRNARAVASAGGVRVELAGRPARGREASSYKVDPLSVDASEVVELALAVNKAASQVEGAVNTITRIGIQHDRRVVATTDGGLVDVDVRLVGISHATTGKAPGGGLEMVYDSKSMVAGWEFLSQGDWESMAVEVSKLAVEASRAPVPEAGRYTVILEPEVVGLLLHEAFGHASEGDIVASGASVLRGRLGERVAPEYVTIVDDGRHPQGYYVPFDDEASPKGETIVVDRGVLKTHLTGRVEAAELGLPVTGNARVQSYRHPHLVRQTNFYMKPGDWGLEEMISDTREGLLITVKGARGGQTDPGQGTFTFNMGVTYRIEGGEIRGVARGVSITGRILEVLNNIDAVGRDLRVSTSVFGGCGKSGQLVRVGDGGPHVRVRGLLIGGR